VDYSLRLDKNAEAKQVIAPYIALAPDVEALITAINTHLLGNTMPEVLKQGSRDTVATTTDPTRKAKLALYLALTSADTRYRTKYPFWRMRVPMTPVIVAFGYQRFQSTNMALRFPVGSV